MSTLHCSMNCMYEFAYMVFVPGFNETFWLLHVNIFFCEAIQVCSNKIDLPKLEVVFSCYGHSHSDRLQLGNSCLCLIVVDPKLLSIAFPDQSSFIFDTVTFPIPFNVIYLHWAHDVHSWWRLYQIPGMLCFQRLHLNFHQYYPSLWVCTHCMLIGSRDIMWGFCFSQEAYDEVFILSACTVASKWGYRSSIVSGPFLPSVLLNLLMSPIFHGLDTSLQWFECLGRSTRFNGCVGQH